MLVLANVLSRLSENKLATQLGAFQSRRGMDVSIMEDCVVTIVARTVVVP